MFSLPAPIPLLRPPTCGERSERRRERKREDCRCKKRVPSAHVRHREPRRIKWSLRADRAVHRHRRAREKRGGEKKDAPYQRINARTSRYPTIRARWMSHKTGIPLVYRVRVPVLGRRFNNSAFSVPVAFDGLNTGT